MFKVDMRFFYDVLYVVCTFILIQNVLGMTDNWSYW